MVPYGHWKSRENCLEALRKIAEANDGVLSVSMRTPGAKGLLGAIRRYHGGIASFRKDLGISALVEEPDYSSYNSDAGPDWRENHRVGKAGEHLVLSDLFGQGYEAVHAGERLPYDVVAFKDDGSIYKIQVKTARVPTMVNWVVNDIEGLIPRGYPAYRYKVRAGTQGKHRHLDSSVCDIVACVALDIRVIGYFTVTDLLHKGQVSSALDLRSRLIEYPERSRGQRIRYIQDYGRFPSGN